MSRQQRAEDCDWCQQEFSSVEIGDKRLKMRLIRTPEQLSSQPLSPINQACETWADTKAAYRLFANEKVEPQQILSAHIERTRNRMNGAPLLFAIQDTTYLNYTDHPKTTGLGHIGTAHQKHVQGLIMHSTLAVNLVGVPLGLIHQETYSRPPKPRGLSKGQAHKRLSIEEKESHRWLRALDRTILLAPAESQVVTLADREADIYEFMAHANDLNAPFVIRAAWNRSVETDEDELSYLWSQLESAPVSGRIQVEVPKHGKDPARIATVVVSFDQVDIRKPVPKAKQLSKLPDTVSVYAVYAREIHPPKQVTPLEWMLLTNVPVKSRKDALERISWYKLRWTIESWHKILKSGCNVEKCRLQTSERLRRFLTLFSVVAWRLHWVTYLNREKPESPCDTILSESEWKALYCRINKTRTPPNQPPTTREAIRWIARLGGFLGRKHDGEPGTITLWRGWQRLADISEDWTLFSHQKTCG